MTKHKHPSSAAHPHPNREATQRPPRNLRSDIIRESESWVGQRHHSSLSTNHDNPGRFCRALWLDTGHRAELCVGVCVWEHAHVCVEMGGAGICVSIVQASSLPRGNPVQTPLSPGNLPPVCRKHILHGWLNWIIITGCLFGKRGKKKNH